MMEGMKLVGIKYDLWLKTNFMPSHLIPRRKLVGIVLVGILLVGKEYGYLTILVILYFCYFSIDVVLLDPGPHRHDRTARGLCVYRACRI